MSGTKETLKYAGVALLAGAVGMLIGILVAPASGRETRRSLERRMREAKDDLIRKGRRAAEEAAGRLEVGIEQGKRKLAEAVGG